MKHLPALFFICLSIAIAVPFVTHGAGPTISFGGRIYLAPIPGVTCVGTGTSTISSANVSGATQAATSGNIGSTIGGIHDAIPVYTTDPSRRPRFWKQILGRKYIIPDFSTCHVGSTFPIPVLKTTNNYNVSR